MGPRLGSRGKHLGHNVSLAAAWLQWGRDLEVAERDTSRSAFALDLMLQWGRDLEVAESGVRVEREAFIRKLQWGRDLEVAERSTE